MSPLTPESPWVQVLDSQDMDQHALAQQGWALQYEQLSPGQFKGRIHQVQLPEVTLLREDTSIALRQRGQLHESVYGFAMALQDSPDLFFNGQRVPAHAIMCGKGDEVDLTTPPHFTLIAVVVNRSLLNPLWERMYQKPLAHWLEKQLVLQTTDEPFIYGDIGLDNTGARSTGSNRLTANMNINSPSGRGELVSLNALHTQGSNYGRAALTVPDGYNGLRLGMSASSMRYKVIGNAVPPPLFEAVARALPQVWD